MYSKILVPLDGSELSECSLEHIKPAATGGGTAEVILLRVVEPPNSGEVSAWSQAGYTVTDVQNRIKKDARDYVSRAAEKLVNQGISARSEMIEGRAAETILDYAEKNGVDLIIISTHGRSGISRWAFGSVADRVVRHSPIPVLVISAPGCRINK